MNRGIILSATIFLALPLFAFAAETSPNTGFVLGSVWLSETELKIGDKVSIYSAVFNGESERVEFVVEFVDGETILGKTDVSVSPRNTETVSFSWEAVEGRHNLFARITSASIGEEDLVIENTLTKSKSFTLGDEPKTVSTTSSSSAGFLDKIKFKDGSFGDKAKIFVENTLEKINAWRETTKSSLEKSIDIVKESRTDPDNLKTEIRAMSFLHLSLLQILKFIVSVTVVFYALYVVLAIIVIKKLIRFISWIFRRKAEQG